jgi:hypothetical protein
LVPVRWSVSSLCLASRKANMAPKNKNRDYAKEERWADRPENRKRQAARMRARRLMEKEGRVKPHDDKEVDHKKFLGGKGGEVSKETTAKENLRVVSTKTNRKKQPKRK